MQRVWRWLSGSKSGSQREQVALRVSEVLIRQEQAAPRINRQAGCLGDGYAAEKK